MTISTVISRPFGAVYDVFSPSLRPRIAAPSGRGLAVDVELGADGDLAVAEQEDLFAAGDDRRDDGAGLDDAGALRSLAHRGGLEQVLERADAGLLLALLVLGGVVAAVLLEVALFARGLDALGDLLAAGRREVLELGGEAVVGILGEEGHGGIAGHV